MWELDETDFCFLIFSLHRGSLSATLLPAGHVLCTTANPYKYWRNTCKLEPERSHVLSEEDMVHICPALLSLSLVSRRTWRQWWRKGQRCKWMWRWLLTPSLLLLTSSFLLPSHNSIHPPFSPPLKSLVFISCPSTLILFLSSFHPHPLPSLSPVASSFQLPHPPPLSLHPSLPSLHSSVFQLPADSIVALLLRRADSLSVLAVGFKHTKSTPERNRYFATEISPFPGEYSLKWYNNWHG